MESPRKAHLFLLAAALLFTLLIQPISHAQEDELKRASRLNLQVEQLREKGKYAEAVPLAKEVMVIYEEALGPDHPNVAMSLSNLALLYDERGQYEQSEPLYKRSLAIREKTLGPNHPDVATSLNNLAENKSMYAVSET